MDESTSPQNLVKQGQTTKSQKIKITIGVVVLLFILSAGGYYFISDFDGKGLVDSLSKREPSPIVIPTPELKLNLEEKQLLTIPEDKKILSAIFSPNGNSALYFYGEGQDYFFDTENTGKIQINNTNEILFSPDGSHWAIEGTANGKSLIVHDGIAEDVYDSVEDITFSPDGERLAYKAVSLTSNDSVFIVANGKAQKTYSDVGQPVFSPDGKNLAYRASLKGTSTTATLVVNGEEKSKHDWITDPVFSPNGEHLAYVVYTYGKLRETKGEVILDGETIKIYEHIDGIEELTFSPDSSELSYIVRENDPYNRLLRRYRVIRDGEEVAEYSWASNLVYSPNGEHLLHVLRNGTNQFVTGFPDKRIQGGLYNQIDEIVISPDSKHFAYRAKKDDNWFVIINGHQQGPYGGAHGLTFSPDSNHFAFVANTKTGHRVVLDGVELDLGDEELVYHANASHGLDIRFSPDSNHILYSIGRRNLVLPDGRRFLRPYFVVNGKEVGQLDVHQPRFSPDSKKIVYGEVELGFPTKLWWRVLPLDDMEPISTNIQDLDLEFPIDLQTCEPGTRREKEGRKAIVTGIENNDCTFDYSWFRGEYKCRIPVERGTFMPFYFDVDQFCELADTVQ